MLPSLFDSTTIPVLQEVVNFAESRHAVLAGNIANLDVPGYKTRDLSVDNFQDRLKEVINAHRDGGVPWSGGLSSSNSVMGGSDTGDPMRHVRESAKTILHHDGSDVGLEQQVSAVTKNQMQHTMAIAIMGSQFRLIQTAISERV